MLKTQDVFLQNQVDRDAKFLPLTNALKVYEKKSLAKMFCLNDYRSVMGVERYIGTSAFGKTIYFVAFNVDHSDFRHKLTTDLKDETAALMQTAKDIYSMGGIVFALVSKGTKWYRIPFSEWEACLHGKDLLSLHSWELPVTTDCLFFLTGEIMEFTKVGEMLLAKKNVKTAIA